MKRILFTCQCELPEHQMIISYFDDEPEVYVHIFLNQYYGFLKRLWYGLKYIFGKMGSSCSGHFDKLILKSSDADKLQTVVNKLKGVEDESK